DDYPIIFVSWHAASAYAKWAGKRLPTEAEWERAARGPDGWRFPYGDEYDETKANTGYARGGPISVGSFDLDSFGIADLSGNVMEWCADWYSEDYYAASPAENPQGPETGTSHVARGGSWGYVGDRVGAAFRYHMTLPLGDGSCNDRLGFRCAMDVPEAQ
ncbi:MAG TPA: SUMF1/EgtB/PvdO family nonheme iron enzyme, partial [Armatimonadota bacterium]|nr:SUMF1/EgtB/PvdO family nonheme iron enzyme [Armatimonadota bacterium]